MIKSILRKTKCLAVASMMAVVFVPGIVLSDDSVSLVEQIVELRKKNKELLEKLLNSWVPLKGKTLFDILPLGGKHKNHFKYEYAIIRNGSWSKLRFSTWNNGHGWRIMTYPPIMTGDTQNYKSGVATDFNLGGSLFVWNPLDELSKKCNGMKKLLHNYYYVTGKGASITYEGNGCSLYPSSTKNSPNWEDVIYRRNRNFSVFADHW